MLAEGRRFPQKDCGKARESVVYELVTQLLANNETYLIKAQARSKRTASGAKALQLAGLDGGAEAPPFRIAHLFTSVQSPPARGGGNYQLK